HCGQGTFGLVVQLDSGGRADRGRDPRRRALFLRRLLGRHMPRYVGALDQGTTSTRFMVFDAAGAEVARRQIEHTQIMPKPGWVEHDPVEIAARTNEVITGALRVANLVGHDLAAIGVTNQRETTVVWNPKTGRPWYNAIVWQDTRTDRIVNALEPKRQLICERTG